MDSTISTATFQRLVGVGAFAALTMGFAAASHAAGALDGRAVTIEFRGASASTPQGASALYQRIQSASEYVCSVIDHGDLASARNFRACVRATISDTVKKVDRQALTTVFEAKYPTNPPAQLLAEQQR
jgi:UrcA family protein